MKYILVYDADNNDIHEADVIDMLLEYVDQMKRDNKLI